ncbi:hypothetical protein [Limosilactobacillus mucosae]|uniref:hypothetical protein n=1 Tax=Limosilactobacillus mucosae TaxID=97478 RepID=UPI003991FB1A
MYKTTNNPIVTKIFELEYSETFRNNGKYHLLKKGSEIYPRDYFCYPSHNKKANYMEHLFDNSWNHSKGNRGVYGAIKYALRKLCPVIYAIERYQHQKKYYGSLLSGGVPSIILLLC